MFKPAPMRKARLIILDEDMERLIRRLQEEGLIQLFESPILSRMGRHEIRDADNEITTLIAKVERMTSLLEDASEKRKEKVAFLQRIRGMAESPPSPELREVDFLKSYEETIGWCKKEIEPLAPKLDQLGENLKKSTDDKSKLEEDLHLIRELLPIKVPLKYFRTSEMTVAFFFYLPADRVEPFSATCREQIDPVHVSVISGTTRRLVMVMGLSSDRVKLLTQIHRFEGEIVELPPYDETPSQVEIYILGSLAELDKEIEDVTESVYRMALDHLEDLKVVDELLTIEKGKIEALKLLARTKHTILLNGWIPEKDSARFEEVVSSSTSGRYILRTESPSCEEYTDVPVSFANRWPFSTFEWITRMYGMPSYREVDPTPILAPTFVVFFGTCLSDAGYGLILALLSFFVLRKMWGERMGTALMMCGLATILMGWLLGGWFGNILYSGDWGYGPQISFFKAAWVDPLSSGPEGSGAVSLLSLALLMGIIHLILGHITAIMVSARQSRLLKGLVTHIGWCLTLVFGSIFVLWYLGMTEANSMWQMMSKYGLAIGILMGIFGYVWERSGSARAAGPAQFIYDILGHIADVISYSRLLALGISTAVNAFLIDLIIFKFAWPSFAGGPLRIIVAVMLGILLSIGFVLLHLINMGLNCLSGFVHTMRLHFAEYFSKFYESGGDEFVPFKSERFLTTVKTPKGVGS